MIFLDKFYYRSIRFTRSDGASGRKKRLIYIIKEKKGIRDIAVYVRFCNEMTVGYLYFSARLKS